MIVAGGTEGFFARSFHSGLSRYAPLIARAEATDNPAGRKVLKEAHRMIASGVIIPGSCWNWLDTVYRQCGYGKENRRVLFSASEKGPYAPLSLLRPGDWIFHRNHAYGNIGHSGMFVGWIDRQHHRALMVSYGGEGRQRPGRYRVYDISHTYHIIRPGGRS